MLLLLTAVERAGEHGILQLELASRQADLELLRHLRLIRVHRRDGERFLVCRDGLTRLLAAEVSTRKHARQ